MNITHCKGSINLFAFWLSHLFILYLLVFAVSFYLLRQYIFTNKHITNFVDSLNRLYESIANLSCSLNFRDILFYLLHSVHSRLFIHFIWFSF